MAEPMDRPEQSLGGATPGRSLLRRRWWAVLLGVLLGLAAGQAFTSLSTPTYSSTTAVLVLPTRAAATGASGAAASDINMNTESELVRSADVARDAGALLRSREPATALLDRLTVTVPTNSQVLSVSYASPTALGAQQGARAFAQAYLNYRAAEVKSDVERLSSTLRSELKDAEEQLRLATDKAAALPTNSPDRVYAEAQRDILGSQISSLKNRLTTLGASNLEAGQVITEAVLPASPTSPVPMLDLLAGLVLGLVLGAALAALVDRLDHRVRRAEDVQRQLRLPVVADLVSARVGQDSARFDRARNSLLGQTPALRLLQVSDPAGRGASGPVALEFARTWIRATGEATLVVAHPESGVPDWAGLVGQPGLSDVLRGDVGLDDALHGVHDVPGLRVMPAGRRPEQLESLLQAPSATRTLMALERSSSVVVLETLGTGTSAAAQALATQEAVVVLVAETGADIRTLNEAADGAQRMGADLAGVVLVGHGRPMEAVAPQADADAPRPALSATSRSAARPRQYDEPPGVPATSGASVRPPVR